MTAKATPRGVERVFHQFSGKATEGRKVNKSAQSLLPGRFLRKLPCCSSRPTSDQRSFHSHHSWRSLFFYLCTDEISFAPLKSQGGDFRLACILGAPPDTAPPCSPKSIYILAGLVCPFFSDLFFCSVALIESVPPKLKLHPLSELAFADIESKLSEDNIVEEFFSRVSSA